MKLTDLAIDRSTTVLISLVLIVIAGGASYLRLLPRESFPEVEIPFVTVVVTYEGVSPHGVANHADAHARQNCQS